MLKTFNKFIIGIMAAFIILAVIIVSGVIQDQIESDKVDRLDNIIRDTLEKYKPDREAQKLSRDTIQFNYDLNKQQSETLEEIHKLLKNQSSTTFS